MFSCFFIIFLYLLKFFRGLDDVIDQQLVKEATPLLTAVEKNELAKFQQKGLLQKKKKKKKKIKSPFLTLFLSSELEFGPIKICSIDRTVGTLLSYYVAQACGDDGLPDSAPTLKYLFTGSAGQSFAAWLAKVGRGEGRFFLYLYEIYLIYKKMFIYFFLFRA